MAWLLIQATAVASDSRMKAGRLTRVKILKPTDLTILTNETPFTNSQLAKALVEMWFAEENEERKEIANRKARDRRAKQKEVV
jgi:hypothetical protein